MKFTTPAYFRPSPPAANQPIREADFVIYGATAAGIIAAVEAKSRGLRVLVVNPGWHIGGMTTGGLGYTDFGNEAVIGGRAHQFYQDIGRHYGVAMGWAFEPSVAAAVFSEMIRRNEIEIVPGFYIAQAHKRERWIYEIISTTGSRVSGRYFMDASYEGDLMAAAKVSYTTGRESNYAYGEIHNGFQLLHKNQFVLAVDPFVKPGHPASGLLQGIHRTGTRPTGSEDKLVQAYNFRMCMTRRTDIRVAFPKPHEYRDHDYELLARYFEAGWDMELKPDGSFLKYDLVGNGKTDTNNNGGFASDFIGGNWEYPEASYEKREEIFQRHLNYQRGLYWFLQHSPRVPAAVQAAFRSYGLAGDEFTDTQNWPPQLYIRECRRMLGETVITEHHCMSREPVDDSMAMAAYTMDSHNCQRVVVDGRVWNEGDVQVNLPAPYGISYRALTPRRLECANLLVPVCLSATHIAYGSIRMEPVFMSLAQSAAIAVAHAMRGDIAVQEVCPEDLKRDLAAAGIVLALEQIAPAARENGSSGNPSVALWMPLKS
jgi:hypothetical protein